VNTGAAVVRIQLFSILPDPPGVTLEAREVATVVFCDVDAFIGVVIFVVVSGDWGRLTTVAVCSPCAGHKEGITILVSWATLVVIIGNKMPL
jgi:hypothetical protein